MNKFGFKIPDVLKDYVVNHGASFYVIYTTVNGELNIDVSVSKKNGLTRCVKYRVGEETRSYSDFCKCVADFLSE